MIIPVDETPLDAELAEARELLRSVHDTASYALSDAAAGRAGFVDRMWSGLEIIGRDIDAYLGKAEGKHP